MYNSFFLAKLLEDHLINTSLLRDLNRKNIFSDNKTFLKIFDFDFLVPEVLHGDCNSIVIPLFIYFFQSDLLLVPVLLYTLLLMVSEDDIDEIVFRNMSL